MRLLARNLIKQTLFTATCIACALGAGAAAQTRPPPPDGVDAAQQRLQEERLQDLRKRLEPQVDVRIPDAPNAATQALPSDEAPCFVLDTVRLTIANQAQSEPEPSANGESWVKRRFPWLRDAMNYPSGSASPDSPIGKCVGVEGIALLTKRAQEALIVHGFVTTRAVVEAQNLSTGTLTLTVVPGWVNDVRFKSPPSVRPTSTTLAGAAPMQRGDVLNLRDIEQTLENLKRVPSADADFQIEPSSSANAGPDQSDIVVNFSQERYARFNMTVDDGASKSTGPYQGTATVSLDNILALNDTMYLTRSLFANSDVGFFAARADATISASRHSSQFSRRSSAGSRWGAARSSRRR
jgi:hemolysin activation/secretion protein